MSIAKIRSFNRYYARILGIFDKKFLGMDFSVTEVRILGEIGRNPALTANHLAAYLGINKGYLSRTLQGLERQQLIFRIPSETDGRERYLRLTEQGEILNKTLEEKADARIQQQIRSMKPEDYQELLAAMEKDKAERASARKTY